VTTRSAGSRSYALRAARLRRFEGNLNCVGPQTLELIEVAQRGVKDVHDEIDEIDEDPTTFLEPFNVVRGRTFFLHFFDQVLTDRPNVGVRRAARDDEKIRHVGDTPQIQKDDILSLIIQRDLGGALRQRQRIRCRRSGSHEVELDTPLRGRSPSGAPVRIMLGPEPV